MKRFDPSVVRILVPQLLLVVSVAASKGQVRHYGTSACSGSLANLRCPEKYGIAVRTILYGTHRVYCDARVRGTKTCCQSMIDDCIFAHKAAILSMNTYCSGLDSCYGSTAVTGQMPSHNCGFHRSYMRVDYDCIPDKIVTEFCTTSYHIDTVLYIASPAYPGSLTAGNTSCNCLVTAGRKSNVNITIQAIDILFTSVGYSPKRCEQELEVRSNFEPRRNFTLDCHDEKMYGFREVYRGNGNKWLLTLKSHSPTGRGRLWLVVKATDKEHRLVVRCGPSIVWNEYQKQLPGLGESTRRFIGIGILAGSALSISVFIILIITATAWHCRHRGKGLKDDKVKIKPSQSDTPTSTEKPPPMEDYPKKSCKSPSTLKPNTRKSHHASKPAYATVPRNMESRRNDDSQLSSFGKSSESFQDSPTDSSQREFLHDYGIPPPGMSPYENMCVDSATFPRGRPMYPHDPYSQFYATTGPHAHSHALYESAGSSFPPGSSYQRYCADDEEWPPPYVPEDGTMVDNYMYEPSNI